MTVDLRESADGNEYQSPNLPSRREETYSTDELDLLSPGSGSKVAFGERVIEVLLAFFISLVDAGYIRYILGRGIKTDVFEPLPDIDILDPSGGVSDVPVQQIITGAGIVPGDDDDQHYPITGWLEAYWASPVVTLGPLTTEAFNRWASDLLSRPESGAALLGKGWLAALHSQFTLTREQEAALSAIPPDTSADIQRAFELAVSSGGKIRVDRDAKTGEGSLRVEVPERPGVIALSVGVFHCRFDAHCRNWKCGWGPAK